MPHRAIAFVFVVSALLPGCWLVHGRGALGSDADAGVPPWLSDATVIHPPRDASGAIDAPPVLDVGVIDPPLRCEITRPDASCFESFIVQPGRPFELPFAFDQCGCCIETECAVSVDAASQLLSLTTTLCPDPCDCDACVTPTGTCSVPPLAEGLWRVEVNGSMAFQLPVSEDGGFIPPPPACATYAEVDRCTPSFPFSGVPFDASAICVETGRSSSTLDVVRVHESCGTCTTLDAPCYASLEPRLTDDLPAGGDIHVFGGLYGTSCDVDCPGVCVPRDHECFVPQLVPGDFYRVFIDDTILTSFVAGDPAMVCPD